MDSLYLLIPISVVIVFLAGIVLWWSVKGGQFDDLEGPAYRILHDEDMPQPENEAESKKDQDSHPDER